MLRGVPGRAVLIGGLVCLLVAASAQAAPHTIAEWGHGAGKVNNPYGVAVEHASGDFYVAESSNFRVSKFDAEGHFLLAWGYGVADGKSEELQVCGPAVETRRCFATNSARHGGNPDNNLRAESVAVDNDPASPSYRDVYVGDSHRVSKFTPSGQLIFMVGRNVNKTKREEAGATQAEKDLCTAASGDTCRSGDSGSGENEFSGAVLPLAVGSSGVVWVGDKDRLVSFDSDGAPGAEVTVPGCGSTTSLALDSSGDFYVKCDSLAGIRKLQAGTGTLLETLDAAGNARTVTLDEAGHVFVGDGAFGTTYVFKVYDPAGELVSRFGTGQVIGTPGGGGSNSGSNAIAVGQSAGELYVASSRGAIDSDSTSKKAEVAVQAFPIPDPGPLPDNQGATEILPTSATLKATLNPEGHPTHYSFQYGADETYGQQTPEGSLPASFENSEIEAPLTGLIPDTTYHFRVVASDEGDSRCPETAEECTVHGPDTVFTTLPAVGIEAQWATGVAAHDATLHAQLNPLGVKGSWWLEYGASPCGEGGCAKAAEGGFPAGFEEVPLAVALSGLEAARTYHYRFVAEDERGGETYLVHGPDRTFTTQLAGLGFSLPDNRAWEMVSPADKHGGRIAAPEAPQGGQVQAASNGEALAYLSYGSLEADPQGNRLIEQSSQLARRQAGGSWSTTDITAPHTAVTAFQAGSGLEYKLFSTNLERALMEPRDCTALSPLASERTPYLRENSASPAYEPLVSAGAAPFGGDCASVRGDVRARGATPDLGHVVLNSRVPLLEGAPVGSLYEWSPGALEPLSVIRKEGGGEEVVQAELGSGKASVRGAISEDGSRAFWSKGGVAPFAGLYVRDTTRDETRRLDEVQEGGFGTGKVEPLFQGASADGSVALFTDTQNLTEDANEAGADLYLWRARGSGGCEEAAGCLSDLTAQTENPEDPFEAADVQGLLPGIAADGHSAYLVARGVLDEEPNGGGEGAAPGQPNLYVWREGEGVRFVATLSGEDARDWGGPPDSNGVFYAYKLSATASPSGRYLAFMSKLPLTGYDNRDATSGERAQEVFRYDSVTDELTCVSCEHSGRRPQSLVPGPAAEELSEEFDPNQLWSGVEAAAAVPEATKVDAGTISLYRPRFIQDDGRVFFNAADSLVAADSNGDGDVYEYEPTGVGSCSPSSGDAGTATVPGGCVSLISSGTAEGTSAFLDASEGARDVFFYSPAQLSVTDTDRELDVYDAREGGEPAILEPLAECQGEACQPPATPPETQTPASAAFRGPGNPPGPSRCTASARRAQKLSRRAKLARRHARRLAHNPAKRKAARRLNSRSQRLAHRARGMSKRAKRCRRAERRRSSR